MEHEKCYIYAPAESAERPSKRRRTTTADHQVQLNTRLKLYRQSWGQQEKKIQATLEEADRSTLEQIVEYISSSSRASELGWMCIPTGLIIAGHSIASHGPFFERLGRKIRQETDSAYLVLTSGECPNLKTLLKNLIKKATSRVEEDDEDDIGAQGSTRKGPKMLDFDLGHLQEWQAKNQAEKIIVAIQDSEAFDANLLAEMIDLFYSWLDRLPFVLLFGIATSSDSFEDRLPGTTLRHLDGEKFSVTQSGKIIESVFDVAVSSPDTPLPIGPQLSRRILDRQKDHIQNVQELADGLKYAYMSHFYANCTSIFLDREITFEHVTPEIFEAVRNLPSFRAWVETLLEDPSNAPDIRRLLESDQVLFDTVLEHLRSGQHALGALSASASVLTSLREALHMSPQTARSVILVRAFSNDLAGSPLLREMLLSIKKVSSDRLSEVLAALKSINREYFPVDIAAYETDLQELLKKNTTSAPLRTQYDVRNSSLRTTVVAQKVELSKHRANLSEADKLYSELIMRVHDDLEKYFETVLIDPKMLFLSETLIYDLRSPHSEVFQPKPRFAIERALLSPHDYLGCDCCGGNGGKDADTALAATQPATAILYQLYLESGAMINVSDLWTAFNAILGEDADDAEARTKALFQRGLSELKYLGFIKPSRKKTDHVAKMLWKGL